MAGGLTISRSIPQPTYRKGENMLHFFAKRLKELHEVERDERGFTLIELLIVVIIIGVLAAIAIPTFLAQRDKADQAACRSDTRNAAESAVLFASDNDSNFTGISTAVIDADYGFNQTDGITTTAAATNAGADVTITSDCPAPVGNATWQTDGADAGRVVGAVIP